MAAVEPPREALGIATEALRGARLLCTTIDDIEDVPERVAELRSDLEPVEAVLQQLTEWLESGASELVRRDEMMTVVANCGDTCRSVQGALDRWTRRGSAEKSSSRDGVALGTFRQGRLRSLQAQLWYCKDGIPFVLLASNVLQSALKGSAADGRLEEIATKLKELVASAGDKMSMIQVTINSTSAEDVDEAEGDLEEDKVALLRELEQQRASNEALQALANDALKEVHSKGTRQKISGVRSTNQGRAFAGIFNTPVVDGLDQDIRDISADTGGFSLAGVAGNINFGDMVISVVSGK